MANETPLPIEYEHAKILRELIQHENNLQNYRLTWLMTIQGLLFAALGFAWDKKDAHDLVYVLAALGIIVSISCWTVLRIGSQAFADIKAWWKNHHGAYPGPPLFGHEAPRGGILWVLRPWRFLPWVFSVGWCFVAIYNVIRS